MGGEWRSSSLGDVIELKRGYDLPKRLREQGDVPLISSAGVSDSHSECKVKGPGVVTGRYGTIGQVFYSPDDFWPLNTTLYVRDFKGNDPKFIFYFLKTLNFQEFSDKAAVPGVNRNHLHMAKVQVPTSISEQKAIAHILGALDDKIELNRRMNATLEGMAQTLFKSWFVDFDPVIDNALVAGNPTPNELADRAEIRRQALANDTANREAAKLFPAAFQQTESMGWIPEGWEVLSLDQIADFKNGLALQKFRPKPEEDPLPIVKIAQLKAGEATWDELASPSISPDCIIDDGDVVFSWSGSLIIDVWCGGKAALNQHLFKVTSDNFPKWFYLKWSDEHLNNFQKIAADKAVTMGHIKRSHLSEALCAVPGNDLINLGAEHFDPILERIASNRLHSRSLTKLRDTLLPKLIAGELRLLEAKKLVEASVEESIPSREMCES